MVLTYTKLISSIYSELCDEYFEETEDYYYEIDERQVIYALAEIIVDEHFYRFGKELREPLLSAIKDFLLDNDKIVEILKETHYESLKEYFRKEAEEQNKNTAFI